MESMFTQLLAGLTKLDTKYESLSTKLDSKYDSFSIDINSTIDNLRSQFSNLSPTSASINAVTLRSGKQLNPILQRERSAQPSSFPIAENESVSIDTPGCRSTPITLEDSVFPLSSGIDNFAEEEETIPDGVDRHPSRSDNVQILAATKSANRRIPFPKSPKKSRQALDDVRCKAMIDKLIVEMPLVEAIHLSPTIRRYVKTMVIKNLTKECNVMMISEQGSDNIQEQIPKKLPDPGTFVLSVTINHDSFPRALCDLGSSVNLMPRSVAMRLGYSNLEPTFITLVLADRSTRIPYEILIDVPVIIGKSMILTDFVVLPYEKEPKDPLILGRSFLHTAGAIIDVQQGRIGLNVGDLTMQFDMNTLVKKPIIEGKTFLIDSFTSSSSDSISEIE